ncbi:MAG: universal stress protein [Deltaproteobacteria bacterium]|nr:universal stress protein [Deltaproteobacteria bacterium]
MTRSPFTRILVATLGSSWSQRALELAVKMAKVYQLELVVVAVVTPAYVPEKKAPFGVTITSGADEETRRRAREVLEKASSLAESNGIKAVFDMREGRAADEILKSAQQHQCDLILIGSRGPAEISRVTLGEAGNEVILKAQVPVMVVK